MAEKTVPATIQSESRVPATREDERFLVPPVDIFETETELTAVADLPAVGKADVGVSVQNDILTISGKIQEQTPGQIIYQEFELLNFFRQFHLSERVDKTKIAAEMKNGILTVHLPRVEADQPKQITVKVD